MKLVQVSSGATPEELHEALEAIVLELAKRNGKGWIIATLFASAVVFVNGLDEENHGR